MDMARDFTNTLATELCHDRPGFVPDALHVVTALLEIPPGDPGTPPHRHSGPVYGYVLEGELLFELEGRPERVVCAGDAFSEPGGDVIHYRNANNCSGRWTRFVVVMLCADGQPMLTLVEADELAARADRRHQVALMDMPGNLK